MKTNESLALLYVQSRDLSRAKPGDLLVLYKDALDEINAKENELYERKRDPDGRPLYPPPAQPLGAN